MSEFLALIAAFCFALAATLQQKGALRMGGSLKGAGGFVRLVRQPWWLAGTLALLVGYGTQAVALSNGQLAIVQALLVTTIVFALPLGYLLTNQQVNRTEIGAALLVVLGLGLFTIFGDEGTGRTTAPTSEWVATFALFGAVAAVLAFLGRTPDASRRAAYLGASAGVLYALSAAMWKPTSEALSSGGLSGALASWEFYVWLGAAVIAFVVQQVSLAAGDLASSVATVSVCNPIVSVIIGIVVLEETLSGDLWNKALAFGGLGLALFAAIVITRATEGSAPTAVDASGPANTRRATP
jgi:drug/metabolite transporter (DMT)-like permease